MKNNHIWKIEQNTIVFVYLKETRSILKVWTKNYYICISKWLQIKFWKFESNTLIFEYLNDTQSCLKI